MPKRLIAVLLSIVILCVGTMSVSAESISNAIYTQNNYEATSGYSKLLESFDIGGITADPSYPQNYGGAYINDNGILVVQYVGINESIEKSTEKTNSEIALAEEIREITALQKVITEQVDYSYNELVTTNNIIGQHIARLTPNEAGEYRLTARGVSEFEGEIVQSAIDAKNNSVVVWLDDISQESIENFRKYICDKPYLVFNLAMEERPVLQSSYESGEGWVNFSQGSIGFPATYESHSGFVTAWHCIELSTNYINDEEYGQVYSGSRDLDYAFVMQENSSISISRDIYDYTKSLTKGGYGFVGQGSEVGRTGYGSGYSDGKVTYTGVNNNLGEDLIQTDCGSLAGDSGGPYFSHPTTVPYIAGIHIGGYNEPDIDTTYFRGISYLYDAGYRIE